MLDAYAMTNPVEFFAVAVETFFSAPVLVGERHPELYAMLSSYFAQDPAGWDRDTVSAAVAPRSRRVPSSHDPEDRLEGMVGVAGLVLVSLLFLLLWARLADWQWARLLHPGVVNSLALALTASGALVVLGLLWVRERLVLRNLRRPPPVEARGSAAPLSWDLRASAPTPRTSGRTA